MILLFIFNFAVTPSVYFTSGDFSNNATSFSTGIYASVNLNQHYLLLGYDNYKEKKRSGDLSQNLFSFGYTKSIIPLLIFQTIGYYLFNSVDNIGSIISNRISYGYKPTLSLGYSYVVYSNHFQLQRYFHSCSQINPELQYHLTYRTFFSLGLLYTNAEQENYFAYSGKINLNPIAQLQIEASLIYGKIFHHVDDRLLVINNRPNIQNSSIGLRLKYQSIIKNVNIAGIIKRNSYDTYRVTYYALGIEYERK